MRRNPFTLIILSNIFSGRNGIGNFFIEFANMLQVIKKFNGNDIEAPSKKEAIKNFPGSGNLSDFQIKSPIKIGGSIVAK